MSSLEGDVLLFQTPNNGDICVEAGNIKMTGGFETAAYLSLFGGNKEDDGRAANRQTWWGNLMEIDPAKKYISRTQFLAQSLPAVSANLRRIEDAALQDLQWFLDYDIASSVTVEASIPDVNKLRLEVNIFAEGDPLTFEFIENWRDQAA